MPSFIKFTEIDLRDGRKTRVWAVMTVDGRHCLGRIGWYAPWRKYSFITGGERYQHEQVILEETCLRDIADFCQQQTGIHRQLQQYKRKPKPTAAMEATS